MQMDAVEVLDGLVDQLGRAVDKKLKKNDAIDDVLSSPARTTAVESLRNSPVITAFRRELTDGLIRVDTASKALTLVGQVVNLLLAGRV
jgi:hypothetical protein